MMSLVTVREIQALRDVVKDWRAQGLKVGLVPTMGALHNGHIELVKTALSQCDRVITTIFVNPTQFGPNEDLDKYPRTEKEDALKLDAAGGHVLFAPSVEEVYGRHPGRTTVQVSGLGTILEGEFRPGFFDGVATIVTKLLMQSLPDCAFFGEKDFQQLCVIKRLVEDLNIPVEIVGVPTVREADGLAMSSRNVYLSVKERAIAPTLHRAITFVSEGIKQGKEHTKLIEEAKNLLLEAGFQKVDYIEARKTSNLAELADAKEPMRVLAAALLGKARLIDNVD